MDKLTIDLLLKDFSIDKRVLDFVSEKESLIKDQAIEIDKIREYNQYKVISGMQNARLSSTDFNWTSGYGYGDQGRDKVEDIYARVFNTEDALVRPSIASGTHAISLALAGILRPNDQLISISGKPYDTLEKVIGTKGGIGGSLMEFGIDYKEIDLVDNKINTEEVIKNIGPKTKMLAIQRSTGYSSRRALTVDEIGQAISELRKVNKDIIIFVDNCYGEFLEFMEPTDVGADIMAGSLIKNPGGGIALAGGYIVGKADLIDLIANRLTAPGIGKECGLTFGTTRSTLQGLFLAPHVVSEAVKGALLVAYTFKDLGFKVIPDTLDKRSDIIQGIEFNDPDKVVAFCRGIQAGAVVDSYIIPEAWNMPGYEDKVIMAAGGFIDGSSIELSADGPIREPYIAYYQGGLTYDHCKLGLIKALDNLVKENLITL